MLDRIIRQSPDSIRIRSLEESSKTKQLVGRIV